MVNFFSKNLNEIRKKTFVTILINLPILTIYQFRQSCNRVLFIYLFFIIIIIILKNRLHLRFVTCMRKIFLFFCFFFIFLFGRIFVALYMVFNMYTVHCKTNAMSKIYTWFVYFFLLKERIISFLRVEKIHYYHQ